MLNIGLNPYGVSYTVGLQADPSSSPRPEPLGLTGFVDLARNIGARCIELDGRWLTPMSATDLTALGRDLAASGTAIICSSWLAQVPRENLANIIEVAARLGATLLRLHLTPVLEGARAAWGDRWSEMVTHARATLQSEARRAADAGVLVGIENHQDFTSDELINFADEAGSNVGIVLDTGNPFSVGEDPVAFVRRTAPRIVHVHLKDYVAQFTHEGYRLIRCALGDGCVPFAEIAALIPQDVTASIELAALDARHIRLFGADWWRHYQGRPASELGTALGRLRHHRLDENADWRTPWERQVLGAPLIEYELDQLHRSVANLRAMGWM